MGSNAGRNRETNTKLRTLNSACQPPFSRLLSHWERQGGGFADWEDGRG